MKNNNRCFRLQSFIVGVFLLSIATSAHAALVSRLNGQAVYDTDNNITWLADANLAASNTFSVGGINLIGQMSWFTAQNWIGAINSANYLGYNDWRLPVTLQPDASCSGQNGSVSSGTNCTGSEMGHLFYSELGGTAWNSILTSGDPDLALFQNIQAGFYWFGSEFAPLINGASVFAFVNGNQDATDKGGDFIFAWAVRTGDVAAVPLPTAFWLFGSGLIGMLGFIQRRKS